MSEELVVLSKSERRIVRCGCNKVTVIVICRAMAPYILPMLSVQFFERDQILAYILSAVCFFASSMFSKRTYSPHVCDQV